MTKKTKELRKMTSVQLADALLFQAHKMTSIETATKRAALLCSALSEFDSKRPPMCFGEDRCERMSCPPCRVWEQRIFVPTALPIAKELGIGGTCRAITVVPWDGMVGVGELPKGGLRGFKNKFAAKLKKMAPNAKAIFWVDISLERRIGQPDYWQWHFHGLIWGLNKQSYGGLRKCFAWPKKGSEKSGCARPVQCKRVTDIVGCLAYMSKSEFKIGEPRIDSNGEQLRTTRTVSIQQEVLFASVLSKFKASQRFFYVGMDRQ